MTLIAFADSPRDLEQLTSALEAREVSLAIAPDEAFGTLGESPAGTASALIASERLLVERRPAAVVLAGSGNPVLAAALAASKLEVPVIRLKSTASSAGGDGARNARLLALVADLAVGPDGEEAASTIDAWLRRLPETASARSATGPAGR